MGIHDETPLSSTKKKEATIWSIVLTILTRFLHPFFQSATFQLFSPVDGFYLNGFTNSIDMKLNCSGFLLFNLLLLYFISRNIILVIPSVIMLTYLLVFTGILVVNSRLTPPPTTFDIVDEKNKLNEQFKGLRTPEDMEADHTFSIQDIDQQLYS